MIKHRDHFHGSDLEKIETIYHIKKEDIISFSANVNPLGISPKLREELSARVDVIASYPDREYTALRKAIADYCGAESADIVVGNGTSELISLFIQITHPKRALILGPTYSEYEREVSLAGGRTHYYPLREQEDFILDIDEFIERLSDQLDLIVLCNPNNPTGTAVTNADMRRILDACKQHHIFVLVDETYVEFVEDYHAITTTSSSCAARVNSLRHPDCASALPSAATPICWTRSTTTKVPGWSAPSPMPPGRSCSPTRITSAAPKN